MLIVNVPALPRFYSAYDEVLGHHRRYTKASLTRECAEAGLVCRSVRFWGLTMLPFLAARAFLMRGLSDDPVRRAATARRGMMPPNPAAAATLRVLMRAELWMLRDAPLGTSLLCAACKPPL